MNTVAPLTHRDMLGYWLNERGLLGEFVEVGSAEGRFAAKILSTWKGRRLYLVDPWARQDPSDYLEATNQNAPFDDWYEQCRQLAEQDSRATLVRMLSLTAAKQFSNRQLDGVYLDGAHDYRNVLSDLDAWTAKIRPGGLIGGHDFKNDHEGGACCDVDTAVLRWCQERNITFTVTPCSSWFYIK